MQSAATRIRGRPCRAAAALAPSTQRLRGGGTAAVTNSCHPSSPTALDLELRTSRRGALIRGRCCRAANVFVAMQRTTSRLGASTHT